MHRLAARVWRTVRRLDLMPAGARVLAAVSGGADSVALVHLLRELDAAGRCHLVGIAHLNHSLRGAASDEDEVFCRDLAEDMGVLFYAERLDVRGMARAGRMSVEAAGHAARHAFFDRAAARLQADCVALGHTRDDQAETFLLRLLRGAGPRGLASMYPRTQMCVRPLLDCSRAEVRAYAASRGLRFREDASNLDTSVPRNRLRHEVLPALLRVSPRAIAALERAAAIAREDADYLDEVARGAFQRLVREAEREVSIDALGLCAEPPAVARRVAAAALRRFAGSRFVAAGHIEAVLDLGLARGRRGRRRNLPGQTAERRGDHVVLRPASVGVGGRRNRRIAEIDARTEPGTNSFCFSLSIPGEVRSPLGWELTANIRAYDPSFPLAAAEEPALRAVLDAGVLGRSLTVRNWCPGDRFRPLGMAGRKKLQDFFVDRKVPREERCRVPLVVTPDDRIAWVAGYAVSEDFRVGGATADVVILKLRYWRNGK
jgi:tRNA(Ile)-lysidine synthase